MDAPQPPNPANRVVDISFPRLATTLIALIALMLSVVPWWWPPTSTAMIVK